MGATTSVPVSSFWDEKSYLARVQVILDWLFNLRTKEKLTINSIPDLIRNPDRLIPVPLLWTPIFIGVVTIINVRPSK